MALHEYAAAHIQHLQKSMTQMNVQLHHVVTDITGMTGMKIIRDIVRTCIQALNSRLNRKSS
ncbi:MAG: hypothetical protein LBM75_02465 [Myxococcales bacterium]|jgi:hypothetical protein|nr:hypothetical protein [Myxococcales bacterium]